MFLFVCLFCCIVVQLLKLSLIFSLCIQIPLACQALGCPPGPPHSYVRYGHDGTCDPSSQVSSLRLLSVSTKNVYSLLRLFHLNSFNIAEKVHFTAFHKKKRQNFEKINQILFKLFSPATVIILQPLRLIYLPLVGSWPKVGNHCTIQPVSTKVCIKLVKWMNEKQYLTVPFLWKYMKYIWSHWLLWCTLTCLM